MKKVVQGIKNYFNASYRELTLVVWPSRKQVLRDTTLVIVFSITVAVFLGVLDVIFSSGLEKLLSIN